MLSAARGCIEPAYYYLGSDYRGGGGERYTLTYMSQMGGWSVLDYALHNAADPHRFLRLGYASILSAWALLNSGTPGSNYGYWFPGPQHDGAAGGGFEPAPFGNTWLEQPHTRGSWYYSCEIDLGFCGALRAAATILADDPIFGRFCYGGELRDRAGNLEVVPRDGVRRRFHARLDNGPIDLRLDNDRFARTHPIRMSPALDRVKPGRSSTEERRAFRTRAASCSRAAVVLLSRRPDQRADRRFLEQSRSSGTLTARREPCPTSQPAGRGVTFTINSAVMATPALCHDGVGANLTAHNTAKSAPVPKMAFLGPG